MFKSIKAISSTVAMVLKYALIIGAAIKALEVFNSELQKISGDEEPKETEKKTVTDGE